MLKRWLADTDLPIILVGLAVGWLIGTLIWDIPHQSRLLEDLVSLAQEQKRLLLASARREMAAAAAKESEES